MTTHARQRSQKATRLKQGRQPAQQPRTPRSTQQAGRTDGGGATAQGDGAQRRTGVRASAGRRVPSRSRASGRGWIKIAAIVGTAVLVLGIIYTLSQRGASGTAGQSGRFAYAVGSPGPGAAAPAIRLPSTAGGTFDLAGMRGKTVLLYFQEGLTCQPCWDQLKDIDKRMGEFRALGIDAVVGVTTDSLPEIKQKVDSEGISSPVLSDPQLAVSRAYSANQYGMMGTSRDGHSFVLVGPDGRIRWRADYGGPPNYTMFVPVSDLLADLRAGIKPASGTGTAG